MHPNSQSQSQPLRDAPVPGSRSSTPCAPSTVALSPPQPLSDAIAAFDLAEEPNRALFEGPSASQELAGGIRAANSRGFATFFAGFAEPGVERCLFSATFGGGGVAALTPELSILGAGPFLLVTSLLVTASTALRDFAADSSLTGVRSLVRRVPLVLW